MKPKRLFILAFLVLAVGAFLISIPHVGSRPEMNCVDESQPSSGFSITVDGDKCILSAEDFRKYWHWKNKSAVPLHIAGLVLAAGGIGIAAFAGVKVAHSKKKKDTTGF